jgi:predicted CXXCH cytochrome family protein
VKVIILSSCALLVALVALTAWSGRPAVRADRETLPMTFAHADHRATGCATCHHNFVDAVGFGGECIDCHQTDATVAHLVEAQFHDLCRGCHVERRAAGETAGPVRQCRACHTPDDAP